MATRIEDAPVDRLPDPELLLDRPARAADLVADELLAALFAQAGDLRLELVRSRGRQLGKIASALARRPGVVIRQHAPSQFFEIDQHDSPGPIATLDRLLARL